MGTITVKSKHQLAIQGNTFLLNGEPFDMWGIRVASATLDQELTDHLIGQLDDYKQLGTNAVTVFYQGCRGASYDPFSPDGTQVDAGHQGRMEQIISACDERGMTVVVGIFYFDLEYRLKDEAAVRNAVKLVTVKLKGHGNIIINIANEQNSRSYGEKVKIFDFNDPEKILELCRLVKKTDPDRLVGGGGYDQEKNAVIGSSPDADLLMFDTLFQDQGRWDETLDTCYPWLVEHGVIGKPIVNVELIGGWTKDFPRGVFPEEVKQKHYREVDFVAGQEGLYLFYHNNPWCQIRGKRMRYDLAGNGTEKDPGIRWYFEYVARARGIIPE